jgi:hypothetical protein
MKRMVFVILLFVNFLCRADDVKQPTLPKPPTEPVKPVVPGAIESTGYPKFPLLPSLPIIPNSSNQTNESTREIDRYELNISEAFPNGDTRRNVANAIDNAHYILYSNGNILLKLNFKNGLEYFYHFRNQKMKMEISSGVFKQTYDVIVQAGKEFLLEQYTGELYNNEESITAASIFGDNKVIVVLKFIKK